MIRNLFKKTESITREGIGQIGTKMVVAVVILGVVIIGFTSFFAFRFYRETIIQEKIQTSKMLTEFIKADIHRDMLANDMEALTGTFERLGEHKEVYSVRLLSHRTDSSVWLSSDVLERGQRLEIIHDACRTCHQVEGVMPSEAKIDAHFFTSSEGIRYLRVANPVFNAPDCSTSECHYHPPEQKILGLLDVSISLTQVQDSIFKAQIHTVLFALLAIIGMSTITLLIVRRLILRPVARLAHATDRVGEGVWNEPIYGGRQDELGELTRAFNRMQEKLQFSQRQLVLSGRMASLGQLAAGVAHEINNPLTGILTFSQDLLDETSKDDERYEDFLVIKRESIRCRNIVRNLLDFARPDNMEIGIVDFNEAIRRTIKLVERLARFQNCKIHTNTQIDLPLVRGNTSQLQQVILNLLVNASQAMPKGGDIHIISRHTPPDPLIEIEVIDEGKGMTPEERARIFEPFFSTKEGRTQGLGLSISLGIIEEHGGSLDVSSTPGVGTTFIVRLPAERSQKKV